MKKFEEPMVDVIAFETENVMEESFAFMPPCI